MEPEALTPLSQGIVIHPYLSRKNPFHIVIDLSYILKTNFNIILSVANNPVEDRGPV
jgi:hypothetical protein